ncbi:MAG: hypothetical protein WC907_00530 [Acholeplasmataceae bacterium]
MKKIIVILLIIIIFVVTSLLLIRYHSDPNFFSEKTHLKNVEKRVKSRFDDNDFLVYPLYNKDDKLTHFMIEFESGEFKFIKLYKPDMISILVPLFSGPRTMYRLGLNSNYPWQRYTYDISLDENGNKKYDENYEGTDLYNSPFIEAGYENEKRYLLNDYVLAVKIDGKFFNLISMEYVVGDEWQPHYYVDYIYSFEYDL